MAQPITAEDISPFVIQLTAKERARLIRLMTAQPASAPAAAYSAMPPRADEFSSDEEPLSWDAEGWEDTR